MEFLYPAVWVYKSPLMSLTITECFQHSNWLTASSPLPSLVGATIRRLPISRCFLCGLTARIFRRYLDLLSNSPSVGKPIDNMSRRSSRFARVICEVVSPLLSLFAALTYRGICAALYSQRLRFPAWL